VLDSRATALLRDRC